MTTKINSADAYEDMRNLGDKVFRQDIIDRTDVQDALDALAGLRGFEVPSSKSFLDWARREGIVEPVEGARGHYRWAASVESEAVEIGRQMAEERVIPTDMDPEHPMILQDPEVPAETSLEVETCQHHTEGLTDLSDVADVRAYIVTRQTRIPRKEKKRMKKLFRDATGIEKVRLVHADDLDVAWEMANR